MDLYNYVYAVGIGYSIGMGSQKQFSPNPSSETDSLYSLGSHSTYLYFLIFKVIPSNYFRGVL